MYDNDIDKTRSRFLFFIHLVSNKKNIHSVQSLNWPVPTSKKVRYCTDSNLLHFVQPQHPPSPAERVVDAVNDQAIRLWEGSCMWKWNLFRKYPGTQNATRWGFISMPERRFSWRSRCNVPGICPLALYLVWGRRTKNSKALGREEGREEQKKREGGGWEEIGNERQIQWKNRKEGASGRYERKKKEKREWRERERVNREGESPTIPFHWRVTDCQIHSQITIMER